MAILFIAICGTDGSPIVCRGFVPLKKGRIEGLLSAFPRLVSTIVKGENFVEKDSIRYAFNRLEKFGYLVVASNSAASAIDQVEVLHIASAAVADIVGGSLEQPEDYYWSNRFLLAFAFDEMVACPTGTAHCLTQSQLLRVLTMDSHEETVELALKQRKEQEAKEQLKLKMKQIELAKREQLKNQKASAFQPTATATAKAHQPERVSVESFGVGNNSLLLSQPVLGKGMKLTATASQPLKPRRSNAAAGNPGNRPISLSIEESVSAVISRDGVIQSFEVAGSLTLLVKDETFSNCVILVKQPAKSFDVQFKTHPNIDRQAYLERGELQRGGGQSFPALQNVSLAKWRCTHDDQHQIASLPIEISIGQEQSEATGDTVITVSYNSETPLNDLTIQIPTDDSCDVLSVAGGGSFSHDAAASLLVWKCDASDGGGGVLTFCGSSVDCFLPISVLFEADRSILGYCIDAVACGGSSVSFSASSKCVTKQYLIE